MIMNDNTHLANGCCPSAERLSAWHDGDQDQDVKEHLEHCQRCQRIISDYERIDRAVQAANAVAPPDLSRKIVRRCRRRIILGDFIFYLSRAAAVLLIAVGLFGMYSQWRAAEEVAEAEPEPETTATEDVEDILELTNLSGGTVVLLKRGNRLKPLPGPWAFDSPPHNFRHGGRGDILVGLGDGSAEGSDTPSGMYPMLPSSVRHVWVVDDPSKSKQKILEALPDGVRCAIHVDEGEDSVEFTMWLEEENLLALVEKMSESFGWALVSSELPQPGGGDYFLSGGRQLQYHCTLVSR